MLNINTVNIRLENSLSSNTKRPDVRSFYAHKEVIKELTSYFRDNKIYGLDITKNIILNVTFLVTSDGLSHTPLNAIYIIQGQ